MTSAATLTVGAAALKGTWKLWRDAGAGSGGGGGRGDPLLQLLLGRGADLARGKLAVLEQHQGRNRHDAVFLRGLRALVDVELHDLDLGAERPGDLFQRRPDHAAGGRTPRTG